MPYAALESAKAFIAYLSLPALHAGARISGADPTDAPEPVSTAAVGVAWKTLLGGIEAHDAGEDGDETDRQERREATTTEAL